MKKKTRIFALAGAVLLVLLYASTLIFAFMDTAFALSCLKASIAGTIIIPVLLYGYLLIYRITHKDEEVKDEKEKK